MVGLEEAFQQERESKMVRPRSWGRRMVLKPGDSMDQKHLFSL